MYSINGVTNELVSMPVHAHPGPCGVTTFPGQPRVTQYASVNGGHLPATACPARHLHYTGHSAGFLQDGQNHPGTRRVQLRLPTDCPSPLL